MKRQRHNRVSVGLRKIIGAENAVARPVSVLRELVGDGIQVVVPSLELMDICE